MKECDVEIEKLLNEQINNDDEKRQHFIDKKVYKKINKNTPKNLDINLLRSSLGFDSEDLNKPPHILAHLQGTQNPDTKPTLQKS